jgi:hypothetical protein
VVEAEDTEAPPVAGIASCHFVTPPSNIKTFRFFSSLFYSLYQIIFICPLYNHLFVSKLHNGIRNLAWKDFR